MYILFRYIVQNIRRMQLKLLIMIQFKSQNSYFCALKVFYLGASIETFHTKGTRYIFLTQTILIRLKNNINLTLNKKLKHTIRVEDIARELHFGGRERVVHGEDDLGREHPTLEACILRAP